MKDRLRTRRRGPLTLWQKYSLGRPFRVRPRSGKFGFVLHRLSPMLPIISEQIERLGAASATSTVQIEEWARNISQVVEAIAKQGGLP